jgi:hypothetical protein
MVRDGAHGGNVYAWPKSPEVQGHLMHTDDVFPEHGPHNFKEKKKESLCPIPDACFQQWTAKGEMMEPK